MLDIDHKSNHLDQHNRRNNLEIQGIPANVTDHELEGKVIDIFSCIGIEVKDSDIEDCHRLGYAKPKNAIAIFVSRKFCYQALDKKMELNKLDLHKVEFLPSKNIIFKQKLDSDKSVIDLEM